MGSKSLVHEAWVCLGKAFYVWCGSRNTWPAGFEMSWSWKEQAIRNQRVYSVGHQHTSPKELA